MREKNRITPNLDTEESREFWKCVHEVRMKVDKWPEWKRNYKVDKYSGLTSAERHKLYTEEEERIASEGRHFYFQGGGD